MVSVGASFSLETSPAHKVEAIKDALKYFEVILMQNGL
jgi:hypothetical protein